MTEERGWRWAGLALIAVAAAIFALFNAGERVALSVGFTVLYRVPLVPLIFVAFLAGMTTMFLVGLRHDLRVRRALREAGFGEPIARSDPSPEWGDHDSEPQPLVVDEAPFRSTPEEIVAESPQLRDSPPGTPPDTEPPPRYPP